MGGRILVPMFFEDSTRTTSSFQSAMLKMGGSVLDFDVDRSSRAKGESYADTLRTLEAYDPDILVVRHKNDGFAKYAADIVEIPVINAGDGKHEHPTQTILDLYSVKDIRGRIDGLKITMAGDLKYGRTVHSLASILGEYCGCEINFVSPEYLRMPPSILQHLEKKKVKYSERDLDELGNTIHDTDILYMTRIQRERFPLGPEGEQEYSETSRKYKLTLEMLEGVDPNFRIMHPLPKVDEIDLRIDKTEYAYYFNQVKNGLYSRMALLNLIIGGENE